MLRAAIPLLLLASAAQAQGQDGSWSGRMRCDPIPNMTSGQLNAAFTMTVSGGVARYSREVQTTSGQISGRPETGQGRVGADGSVALEGGASPSGANSWAYTARYAGRIAGDTLTLQGTQEGTVRTVPHRRPCTISLRRSVN